MTTSCGRALVARGGDAAHHFLRWDGRVKPLQLRSVVNLRGALENGAGVVAKTGIAGNDAADLSLSRSGGGALARSGAESAYLAGRVLQFLIAQL